jgi:hypothetical protein
VKIRLMDCEVIANVEIEDLSAGHPWNNVKVEHVILALSDSKSHSRVIILIHVRMKPSEHERGYSDR